MDTWEERQAARAVRRAELDRQWAAHDRAVRAHGYLGMFIAVAWIGSVLVLSLISAYSRLNPDPPKQATVYVSSAEPGKRYQIIDGKKVYLTEVE